MQKNRLPELLLPIGIIACLMIIFMPLPTAVMDTLLAANIAAGVLILLTTIYIGSPLELSIFPSLLLATTLVRLALNVGTTRLILTRGAIDHEMAAGGVIQGFASFVTGDNLAVGLVIFSIIVVIQFVVITKGATRISEVAARFALDGMPGRQMAIDADLNAKVIDSDQARLLRQQVIHEADFYGAMDGASKFVRGDAVAGVIITLINIFGGLAIGMSQQMSIGQAAETFTRLTIGDGLVSQLPALLVSLAAALLVTRSTRQTNLPGESVDQIFSRPIVLVITAIFLGLLVFTALPKIPLLLLAAACLIVASNIKRSAPANSRLASAAKPQTSQPRAAATPQESTIENLLANDMVAIELGVDLIRLANSQQGGNLLNLVIKTRTRLARQMGLILPKVRIHDNLKLAANEFRILIQGNVVERGQLYPDRHLAIDLGGATNAFERGSVLAIADRRLTRFPGYWISADTVSAALAMGYQVKSSSTALADLLCEAAVANATHLLTRDATAQLLDEVRKTSPAVVDELIPGVMSVGQVQQVLKGLVGERVSIRPLGIILETLGDYVEMSPNRWDLIERVRMRLARQITTSLASENDAPIMVFTMDRELQDRIACGWERQQDEIRIDLPPSMIESVARAMQEAAAQMTRHGQRPVALVDQAIRPVIAELALETGGGIFVMGSRELEGGAVETVGEITSDQVASLISSAA